MDGLNRVTILGNLGADPELRMTTGGQGVLNIRVACSESYLDKDRKKQERTEWVNCVIWGKRGEGLAKVLKKGDRILVEGKLRTSKYTDRDGNERYKTEVNATEVLLQGSPGGKRERSSEPARSSAEPHPLDGPGFDGGDDDDFDRIPF
jgi:single-strand DNA-binding protein